MAKKPFNQSGEKRADSAAPPPGLADLARRMAADRAGRAAENGYMADDEPVDAEAGEISSELDEDVVVEELSSLPLSPEEEAAHQAEWDALLAELATSGGDLSEAGLAEDIRQVRQDAAEERAGKDCK